MIVPTCALAAIIFLSLPNGVSAVDTPSVQCGKGAEHCSTEGNNWVQRKAVLSGVGTHSMVEGAEKADQAGEETREHSEHDEQKAEQLQDADSMVEGAEEAGQAGEETREQSEHDTQNAEQMQDADEGHHGIATGCTQGAIIGNNWRRCCDGMYWKLYQCDENCKPKTRFKNTCR